MHIRLRLLGGLAILLVMLSAIGCSQLRARDQLNKGVQSYKNARYEEAIEHFKNAVALDPQLLNARVYLARAYSLMYVPGAETDENKRIANSAIEAFKGVLEREPKNIDAVEYLASLYLQMKDFADAKQYYQKATVVDSGNAENYHAIASIDWMQAYKFRQEERNKLGMKPTDALKDKRTCELVRAQNAATVQEGITALQKALAISPNYDDAMTYMNLLYRERADYECNDPGARRADLTAADDWREKALATQKEKGQRAAGGLVEGK